MLCWCGVYVSESPITDVIHLLVGLLRTVLSTLSAPHIPNVPFGELGLENDMHLLLCVACCVH